MPDYSKVIAMKRESRKWCEDVLSRPIKPRHNQAPKKKPKQGKKNRKRRGKKANLVLDANGYPVKYWTRALRHKVRALYGWECAWCGEKQSTLTGDGPDEWLHIHHKNKNKLDCSLDNLVPLCPACHRLVAHGGRHSDLTGNELRKAIKAQRRKVVEHRTEMNRIRKEREYEELRRKTVETDSF